MDGGYAPAAAGVWARDLGRRFGKVAALSGVSLSLPAGEMLAVVGPDGAGKTTLVQLLAGLLAPTDGTALVAGLDVRTAGTRLGERIGYMSEGFTLYGSLTVAENLAFFADLYGVAASTGTSTAAMLACCAHHASEVFAVLGLSGAALFLNAYKTPLLWLGIVMNAAGALYLLRQIRAARRMACLSSEPVQRS